MKEDDEVEENDDDDEVEEEDDNDEMEENDDNETPGGGRGEGVEGGDAANMAPQA